MKAAIMEQPVCVSVNAYNDDFMMYSFGILNINDCGTRLDHAITAVGYGTEDGLDYFIVRNSWGKGWGENGYIRVATQSDGDVGVCGILLDSIVPTTQDFTASSDTSTKKPGNGKRKKDTKQAKPDSALLDQPDFAG